MPSEADQQRTIDELRHELAVARAQQTATADVLKVISRPGFNLQPVFNTIVQTATVLCEADFALIYELHDGRYELVAANNAPEGFAKHAADNPLKPGRGSVVGRTALERRPVHIPDCLADLEYSRLDYQVAGQYRTMLGVPLLRDGIPIGAIGLLRAAVRPFTDKQIELVTTFADQAVIAINNARLFDEVQARTKDLQESLQQQTATADVLKVISRSAFDLQVVLDTLVESAARLCEADMSLITRQKGDQYFRAGSYGFSAEFMAHMKDVPVRPERGTITGRTLLEGKVTHVPEVLADPDFNFLEAQRLSGDPRTILGVPLLREGKPVGALVLFRRNVRPFTDKQIELVTTFADQAVIAIENVRLFDEVQARTKDLQESLQQQTATADVLKVISRSAFDLQTVFDTLTASATELCEADVGLIYLRDGDLFRVQATAADARPEFFEFLKAHPRRLDDKSMVPRVARAGAAVHIPDVELDPDFEFQGSNEARGKPARSLLGVPLLRNGTVEGVFVLSRNEPIPFTQRQIELVEGFSDQAVIALENVRLFDQVQARTRDLSESLQQQTATADVLKVISRSAFDLQTVLDTLVQSAAQLCEADMAAITRRIGEVYYRAGSYGFPLAFAKYIRDIPVIPERRTITGRTLLEGRIIHIEDVLADPDYDFEGQQLSGNPRSFLGVPLLREGTPIGALTLTRYNVKPFTEKQIELITTFADQAVIAIENVRLFDEVQARTRDLSQSLENLRTAQDRLIQTEKLASLGQLTAGIAHEIKNPLNFVNNFSAVSVELTDELNDLLKHAKISAEIRKEVDELTGLLKDNLGKVVQHGKRADSIVKNMLLHSREGSGEHRPADINALVDESLNLAYHGARAEKPHFNVRVERDFDPEAGMIEGFPQEITRVFLNLISNGFHAVTKRKADNGEAGYEPVLTATTKGRTDHVEICIRDNGTGIPPEVREKMFNPFFTTKPAGEGTGLGLSMSHDIIVKQHGGRIDVDTIPGEFTAFTIVLPRTSNLSNKSRG